MDPNPDQKSFQFVATFELRGSCDKRFLRLTLRRKVESGDRWRRRVQRGFLGSAMGAEQTLWDPPWGMTDFFGVDPKKVPLVCSAAPPSARPIGPLTPRPLSRKGRGEKELGESAGMHGSIPWAPALCPCPTFFGWSPKKSPFFSAQKSQKSLYSWWPAVWISSFAGFSRWARNARGCGRSGLRRNACLNSASASDGR